MYIYSMINNCDKIGKFFIIDIIIFVITITATTIIIIIIIIFSE